MPRGAAVRTTTTSLLPIASLASAHLIHDSYLAFLSILLPLLVPKLGISLFLAGLLVPIQQVPSVAQPLMGYLADRWNGRQFVVVCVATTGLLMSLVGLVPSYPILAALLVLAGLSSAAYHPAGSALLTRLAVGRWGTALAVYHLGGNLGLGLGPLLVTVAIATVGLERSYVLALPALCWALLLWWTLPRIDVQAARAPGGSLWRLMTGERRMLGLLAFWILARTMGAGGLMLFLPTYLMQRGSDFATAGVVASAFFAVGGVGSLLSGLLSDRIGRWPILLSIPLCAPPLLLTFLNTSGPLSLLSLLGAAALLFGEQPVLIAFVQERLPTHRATAVGFTMGAQFVLGGLASTTVGALGDLVGLNAAFQSVALLPLLGVPALLMLRTPGRDATVPVEA